MLGQTRHKESIDETERADQRGFVEAALGYFERANQEMMLEEIENYYRAAVPENFSVLSEGFGDMNDAHICAMNLHARDLDHIAATLGQLVQKILSNRTSNPQIVVDQHYPCAILATCMYMTALTLMTSRQIDAKEVSTFASKVLTASPSEEILDTYISLSSAPAAKGPLLDICTGAAMLAQMGQHVLAVKVLLGQIAESHNTARIIVTLLVIHAAMQEEQHREHPDRQNVGWLIQVLVWLGKSHFVRTLRRKEDTPLLLISNAMHSMTNKYIALAAAGAMLPAAVAQARSLANFGRAVRGVMKERPASFVSAEPDIIRSIAFACSECPQERRQVVYNACFLGKRSADLFFLLMQEICSGLGMLERFGIVNPEVVDWASGGKVLVKKCGMEKAESDLRTAITDALELLWMYTLLLRLAGLKGKSSGTSPPEEKIEYASCLIRCAKLIPDKNRELKYITLALDLLVGVNFSDPDGKLPCHIFQELGNALGLYLGDWEAALKPSLGKILDKIRTVSSSSRTK